MQEAETWYETARVPSREHARLTYDLDVDVCIVGGGLAGLTVAREVARRGWSVAVLEQNRIATAASGRNTGFVIPGFSETIARMVERIGLDHTKELWALSVRGVDYVRNAIAETGMPGVDPVPGWLDVSKSADEKSIRSFVERLRWIGGEVEAWPVERVRASEPESGCRVLAMALIASLLDPRPNSALCAMAPSESSWIARRAASIRVRDMAGILARVPP